MTPIRDNRAILLTREEDIVLYNTLGPSLAGGTSHLYLEEASALSPFVISLLADWFHGSQDHNPHSISQASFMR